MRVSTHDPKLQPQCPSCHQPLGDRAGDFPIPGRSGIASVAWDECPECETQFYAMLIAEGQTDAGRVEIGL